MKIKFVTMINKTSIKELDVNEAIFNQKYNEQLVHQLTTTYMNSGRQGTRAQKNRSLVSGGGAKPWAQKGTGRARSGTSRSPIWRKGGVTFAAKPKDFSPKINRKMYRLGICSILSELVRSERLFAIEKLDLLRPKTKDLINQINQMKLLNILFVSNEIDENLYLASRNLYNVGISTVSQINPVILMKYKKIIITISAIRKIEENYL